MSGNNELLFCFEKMCRIPGIFGPIEAMIGSILVYWYRLVILVRFMHAKEVIFFAWLPNLDLGSLKSTVLTLKIYRRTSKIEKVPILSSNCESIKLSY